MGTQLTKMTETMPSLFNDFFNPWNEWLDNRFWGKTITVPAVNIKENKEDYMVSLAVPGMKREDFKIDIEGDMLTISCEKEEKKEEKEAKFTRKEYNFSSFSRSFTLPEEVNKEKIEAQYTDGLLKLTLPKKEEAKKLSISKHIAVK
ncbi:MAG TPA: Hsp20/alpha crystallin family protein [Chitinophagaceae bacterium]|nr:Hsp20/alpha crystallin family protein [Chitinophagaceae bacterium]